MGTTWAETIWVTRFVEWCCDRTIDRPMLVGPLTIGLAPVVLSVVFFAMTWGNLSPRYVLSHLLVVSIGFVGPALIWYWERTVFRRFVEDVRDLTPETAELERIASRHASIFRRWFWVFSVTLTVLLVGVILNNMAYFRTLGVAGVGDPAFWVLVLIGIAWGAVVGVGFHIAIVAILFVRTVGELELRIEPLHPDGLGGLSAIGTFAIWTTMLISIGSLAFPYVFLLASESSSATILYGLVGCYVLVIALSFLYPTVYVNRRAQTVREQELDQMRARIRELEAEARDPVEHGATDEVAKRLEIRRLRDEFREYSQVSLYPLSIGIITRLLTSIFLPIFFIVFEMWFSSAM